MLEAIILLGAPGSGKGTTAEDMKSAVNELIHVSTGNMLREALQAKSEVGLEAKKYMDKGELVPDEVVMKIVSDRLAAGPSDARYIFDGFPRTSEQARLLDAFLEDHGRGRVSHVFLLEVEKDVLVDRIAGRLICRECGAVYHVTNIPPKVDGVCDTCGGELYQRADDNRETVLNRLEVYHRQTASLIDYYAEKNVLRRVDALERDDTLAVILGHLQSS